VQTNPVVEHAKSKTLINSIQNDRQLDAKKTKSTKTLSPACGANNSFTLPHSTN